MSHKTARTFLGALVWRGFQGFNERVSIHTGPAGRKISSDTLSNYKVTASRVRVWALESGNIVHRFDAW